jgi:hypothetical protein
MLIDPEYAAQQKDINKRATAKYALKKSRETSGPVGSGKPGRIVSLCGWLGW